MMIHTCVCVCVCVCACVCVCMCVCVSECVRVLCVCVCFHYKIFIGRVSVRFKPETVLPGDVRRRTSGHTLFLGGNHHHK